MLQSDTVEEPNKRVRVSQRCHSVPRTHCREQVFIFHFCCASGKKASKEGNASPPENLRLDHLRLGVDVNTYTVCVCVCMCVCVCVCVYVCVCV